MERNEAIARIKGDWRHLISSFMDQAKEPVHGQPSYICPSCGHGAHGDGVTFTTGSDGEMLKCYGCGEFGDIIHFYQKARNVDFNTALADLARMDGITLDHSSQQIRSSQPQPEIKRGEEYYRKSTEALKADPEALSYLKGRGISLETAEAYNLGYDPRWISPLSKSGRAYPSKRLIIPVNNELYIARSITAPQTEADHKYRVLDSSRNVDLFNKASLYDKDEDPLFITEGAIDALSIIEAGGKALALNSTENARILIELLEDHPTMRNLVLALDNDEAGKKATKKLRKELTRLNIPFMEVFNFYPEGCKDPNDSLIKNRSFFEDRISFYKASAGLRPDSIASYLDHYMAEDIERFKAGIKGSTGFPSIDKALGGIFEGLTVVGATSSLGKTTFCHQIADNFACAGEDVLYFSLEQSRLELVTKSLARITAKKDLGRAVTSLSIRCGNFPLSVQNAVKEYRECVGDRMNIIEGNFRADINFISNYIRNYIRKTGKRPIVFIDYLQILMPAEEDLRQNTKETVDNTVTTLKRLSRDEGLTIFAICSVNRTNYTNPIDYESLKESGSIEYGADAVWGLQLDCLNDEDFQNEKSIIKKREIIKTAKAETPRRIEFVCLKNRSGRPNFTTPLLYYPAHDYFIEAPAQNQKQDSSSFFSF